MTELILISAATAFLLAVVEPLISLIAVFISGRVANGLFSIGFASLGTWLAGIVDIKEFVLLVLASAFIGPATLELIEYTARYKPVRTRITD